MPVPKLRVLLSVALAGSQAFAAATDSSWLDVEGRIEYGYYTQDVRTLTGLAGEAASNDAADVMKSYYAALADYRLTLLQATRDKPQAREHAQQCVSNLDHALQAARDFADALALQSVCLSQLVELGAWRAPLAATKRESQMTKAFRAAPKNPRVLLLDAVDAGDRASNGVEKDRALGKLQKAVSALEAERQEVAHAPGWGLADAYTTLGRIYLEKGNVVAARDALEHALLVAPEFVEARRLMTKITSG